MNRLTGHISDIDHSASMSLVTIDVGNSIQLKSIVIETPETANYLGIGNQIQAVFKETEVVIGLENTHGISLQNRITGSISSIEIGQLISKITVKSEVGDIVSIISTNAVKALDLKIGTTVIAMIKLNEIMLSA